MASSDKIPVQHDAEKLCVYTLKITNNLNNFPKKYRYTLVDRILKLTFDIHDGIIKANIARGTERIDFQSEIIANCTTLKFYIRMVYEVLKPECSTTYWDKLVDKVESQVRGWQKTTKKMVTH